MNLLAIDIGNTSITCGIFRGRRLASKFSIPTARYTFSALKLGLAKNGLRSISPKAKNGVRIIFPEKNNSDPVFSPAFEIIISSVVPRATERLENDCLHQLGIKPYILGKNASVPIKNAYRKPKEVGQDRLVDAFAGVTLYGAPLIVVDFGTAVTFDCISKKREYLGGMILPGLGISLEALYRRTALLPAVKLSPPKEFIGRETRTSILSGIVYGMAALADDLSLRIKKKIGKNARVIGTGGHIKLLSKYCRSLDVIAPDLTLKGLYLVHTSCGRD